jgi:hypothetical protein
MSNYKLISKCPITNSEDRCVYLDLGLMPLVNNLDNTKEESLNCPRYPLAVQLFKESGLSTLTVEVDPNILYQHYLYKSGISLPYIEHCKEMFWFVDNYVNLKEGDKILDVGGNDGTLLKTFLEKKPYLDVLNVDASKNLIIESENNGVKSINGFWGSELAESINTRFKLITTTNCFQHTAPIESFVKGISISLDKFGIWCLEFPYWKTSIETDQFDQVYHEHIYYYLLKPLTLLLDKYNLNIIKAVPYPIHGGTMRLLITHKGELGEAFQQDDWSVPPILKQEDFILENYVEWGNKIKSNISKSKDLLLSLKDKGFKIAGFGAAAKGCIYLNSANIDYNQLDYIIDDTNLKQGKFVPGIGVEIVSRNRLKVDPVDYIIILAHNFSEYIIKSLKQDGYRGKFIIFLPKLKIV